jgi:hypothetical protein
MEQTIAQQLGITEFPYEVQDEQGNLIYIEEKNGFWEKNKYDENNNKIYWENSDGYWYKQEFDLNNNEIYYEDSDGYWFKQEFDENNNRIYYENSDGTLEKYVEKVGGLLNIISDNNTEYYEKSEIKEILVDFANKLLEEIYDEAIENYDNCLGYALMNPNHILFKDFTHLLKKYENIEKSNY